MLISEIIKDIYKLQLCNTILQRKKELINRYFKQKTRFNNQEEEIENFI